jgi:integrase
MASTDRRPNGKWRARWREYPGGPQKTKQFDRKLDAQRFLAEIEHRSAIGTYVDPAAGRRPFGELAEAWAAVQDWKPSTRQGWGQTVRRLRSIWRLPLAEIDRLRLERLRAELAQHYSRRVTRNTMLRALAIARYAFECGLIGRDPTVGVDASPKRRADDARERLSDEDVPTRAEALAILRCAPSEYRAAVALGLAGLRIGEVLGMTAEAIDLAGRTVRIDQQAQPLPGRGTALTTPKAEKCRTIRVPELVAIELRRHLRTPRQRPAVSRHVQRPAAALDVLRRVGRNPAGRRPGRPIQVPRAAPLLRLDAAGRGRPGDGGRRPSRRHRADRLAGLRALAPR